MAAVALVLDHEASWETPAAFRRPKLQLVPAPQRRGAGVAVVPALLALAALCSMFFVLATGDGIPASAESRSVAAASQPVVPPVGAAAALDGGRYVVQAGDSLWSVAASLVSSDAVPDLVRVLSELNGGSDIEVGQLLVLPAP